MSEDESSYSSEYEVDVSKLLESTDEDIIDLSEYKKKKFLPKKADGKKTKSKTDPEPEKKTKPTSKSKPKPKQKEEDIDIELLAKNIKFLTNKVKNLEQENYVRKVKEENKKGPYTKTRAKKIKEDLEKPPAEKPNPVTGKTILKF